ncbi:MAG: helix-turn-helix domain-containing protein [Terrimicrobiaceae bacterium]
MSIESKNLFGTRLVQARHMRGLSLRDLEAGIQGVVSAAALNKYERGLMTPTPQVLGAICGVLDLTEDFFERPIRMPLGGVSFRKRSSLGAKEEKSLREHAADFFERYAELEEILGIGETFVNPLGDFVVRVPEDVEVAAEKMRAAWEIGTGPIPSVVGLLESKNLMVYVDDAPPEFDGFAGKAGGRDVIALNATFPTDRRRFTALHELGHVVLKFEGFREKEEEGLCHRFAGAMLIPRTVFGQAFGGRRLHVALEELKRLKSLFGISCAAIMKRAATLGHVAESMMQRFWTSWTIRGYRKNDPGECKFSERPRRFDLLLQRAVAESRISIARAAVLAGEPEDDFRKQLEIFP